MRWGDERTYAFAFEGLEPGGSFSVSTNGTMRDKLDRYYFEKGLERLVDELRPNTIVCYSAAPDAIFEKYRNNGIDVVPIEHYALTVRKAVV